MTSDSEKDTNTQSHTHTQIRRQNKRRCTCRVPHLTFGVTKLDYRKIAYQIFNLSNEKKEDWTHTHAQTQLRDIAKWTSMHTRMHIHSNTYMHSWKCECKGNAHARKCACPLANYSRTKVMRETYKMGTCTHKRADSGALTRRGSESDTDTRALTQLQRLSYFLLL